MAPFRRNLISLLFFLFDSVAILFPTLLSARTSASKEKLTLGIVRLDAIGDFVLWSATFDDLSNIYPRDRYQWVLIGNSIWTNLAESFDCFDEIHSLNVRAFRRDLTYRWKQLRVFRSLACELVIHPTYSRELRVGDSVTRALRTRQRIGFNGDLTNQTSFERSLGDHFYSGLLASPAFNDQVLRHEFFRNAEFLTALAQRAISIKAPDYREIVFPASHALGSGDYFVVSPSAGWMKREWPIENFLSLATRMQEKWGWLCVWLGTADDGRRFREIIGHSKLESLNLFGQTSLAQAAGIIQRSKAVLTNETGPAHLAGACHVPALAFTGGGHYGRFLPWAKTRVGDGPASLVTIVEPMECFGCNWNCRFPLRAEEAVPCVNELSSEKAWGKLNEILVAKGDC